MKLLLEKDKCKFSDSVNGFFLEVETYDPVWFEDCEGENYILYDKCDESGWPAPDEPFVAKMPKEETK